MDELERVAAAGLDRQPDPRDPDRVVDRGLEGVRARGDAGPRRQLRGHLLDRERGPDGRPHRRLDHGRAGPDPLRRRVPAHAGRGLRLHPPRRRGDRRLERAVRTGPDQRRAGHHRDEPPRLALVRAGLEGDRLPHRQDRRPAGGRLHAGRDPQRHHPQDPGQLRAEHRLRRDEDPALGVREAARHHRRPRLADAERGRGDGHRPYVPREPAEGAALAGDRPLRAQRRPGRGGGAGAGRRRAARGRRRRHARADLPARRGAAPGRDGRRAGRPHPGRPVVPRPDGDDRRRAPLAWRPRRRTRSTARQWRRAKQLGFADAQLAHLWGLDEAEVRRQREAAGVRPMFKAVDTCAAEFAAETPYHYSTYEDEDEVRPSSRPQVVVLGSGPNRIGQGIEFDYCCVHAVLRAPRRRLRDRDGQLQPGDRVDRLRHLGPALLRAAHRGGRPERHRGRDGGGRRRAPSRDRGPRRPDAR